MFLNIQIALTTLKTDDKQFCYNQNIAYHL